MTVAVRRDLMPAAHCFANQARKAIRHPAKKKTSRARVRLGKNVEQAQKIPFHARGQRVPLRNLRSRRKIENVEPVLDVDCEHAAHGHRFPECNSAYESGIAAKISTPDAITAAFVAATEDALATEVAPGPRD